jgi:hypothetical protein
VTVMMTGENASIGGVVLHCCMGSFDSASSSRAKVDAPLRMTGLEKALALAGGCGQNYLGCWAQVPDNSTGENQAYSDKLSAA